MNKRKSKSKHNKKHKNTRRIKTNDSKWYLKYDIPHYEKKRRHSVR